MLQCCVLFRVRCWRVLWYRVLIRTCATYFDALMETPPSSRVFLPTSCNIQHLVGVSNKQDTGSEKNPLHITVSCKKYKTSHPAGPILWCEQQFFLTQEYASFPKNENIIPQPDPIVDWFNCKSPSTIISLGKQSFYNHVGLSILVTTCVGRVHLRFAWRQRIRGCPLPSFTEPPLYPQDAKTKTTTTTKTTDLCMPWKRKQILWRQRCHCRTF